MFKRGIHFLSSTNCAATNKMICFSASVRVDVEVSEY